VLAYDTGTNSYKTVERLTTDYQGVAIGNIVLNTQPYKFLLYLNGELAFESTNTFITTTSRTFRLNLREDYFANYNVVQGITSTLTFNNDTKNFAYTFSDASGTIHYGCLKVIRRSINGDTVVNDTCLQSAAGSILVNIGNDTGTNTYLANGYVKFDEQFTTATLSVNFNDVWRTYGLQGIFVSSLLIIGISAAALFNPILAVFLAILSFIMTNVLGIFYMDWQYIMVAVIMGGILIFQMNKR